MTKYKWKLYIDNNIEKEIVDFLIKSDFKVVFVSDRMDLKDRDDIFHYHEAHKRGLILLTRDLDFWDDNKHSLQDSPGVIILSINDISVGKYLPVVFRKIFNEYTESGGSVNFGKAKIKMDSAGFVIKYIDPETNKFSRDSWLWSDLI